MDIAAFRDRLATLSEALASYVPFKNKTQSRSVRTEPELAAFVDTRSSYVAQMALYGYLRTRAGTRFPELFDNEDFLASTNIAKWQIWLACVSDLAVFAGAVAAARSSREPAGIAALIAGATERVLAQAGAPDEAGPPWADGVVAVRQRIAACTFESIPDDDSMFVRSPDALVYWAPVVDELKALDEEIVRNSIRFRWIEVRRELRRVLDVDAVLGERE
jgi:hypothetical protein